MNSPHSFDQHIATIEAYLDRLLVPVDADTQVLIDSARYSSLGVGKRVRGLIVLSMGELLDSKKNFLPLAAGFELIHTYSLIHDDLPAMDDDDLRRGKPSNHKAFGEAVAILTGDYLLPLSYELFSEGLQKEGFPADNILRMIGYLSRNIGAAGMVGGQVMDIEYTGHDIDLLTLEKLHLYKTGLFIEAAFVCPLILVHGNVEWLQPFSMGMYARSLGLLFQIVDDILDEMGNEAQLGKPKGSDKKQGKSTYVSLLGLDGARKKAKELYEVIGLMLQDVTRPDIQDMLRMYLEWIYKREF